MTSSRREFLLTTGAGIGVGGRILGAKFFGRAYGMSLTDAQIGQVLAGRV